MCAARVIMLIHDNNGLFIYPQAGDMAQPASYKVLIVDDEVDTLRLLSKILQADGHQVIEAMDGQTALDKYRQEAPDLILLDILIPHIDGIEVLKRIRSTDQATGIIIVSALTSEKLMVEAMLSGADDYISKPFTLKEIREHIRRALERSHLRRENIRLRQELEAAHAKIRALFERYMPAPVAERLITTPGLPELGGERQVITILFADLRGYSPLAMSMSPDALVEVLNHYLALAAEAVEAEEGTLDKFMGDSVMAFFNAPIRQDDHVLRAVRAALSIQQACQAKRQANKVALEFGIGIHSGEALVGNIGTIRFMNYTAVGEAVNLAKWLQEVAKGGQILISGPAYEQVRPHVLARPLGPMRAKGRPQPIEVYAIEGLRD